MTRIHRSLLAALMLAIAIAIPASATTAVRCAGAPQAAGGVRPRCVNHDRPRTAARGPAATAAALLGDTKVEPRGINLGAGHAAAIRLTATRAGIATAAHVYIDGGSRARAVVFAVYSDAAGHAGKMLSAAIDRAPVVRAWNTALLRPTKLARRATYWLTVRPLGGRLRYRRAPAGAPAPRQHRQRRVAEGVSVSAYLSGVANAPAAGPPTRAATTPTTAAGPGPASPPVTAVAAATSTSARLSTTATSVTSVSSTTSARVTSTQTTSARLTTTATRVTSAGSTTATATVTRSTTSAPSTPVGQPIDCFSAPGACGYPDPNYGNVGARNCAALPAFDPAHPPAGTYYLGATGTLEITANGATLSGLNLGNTSIYISGASNVTINDVCINVDGGDSEGSSAIIVPAGIAGTTIENSTISGMNTTTQSLGSPVTNQGTGTLIENVYTYNSGGGAPGAGAGSATVRDSYELVNAVPIGEHDEPIYFSDGAITIDHSVLLNEQNQTAAVFGDTGDKGACDNHLTVTNSLMAGGDYVLYPCGNAASVGTSTMDIEHDRFARCTSPVVFNVFYSCSGGADRHGYFPYGGSYGATDPLYTYCPPTSGQTWANNVWDDNNSPVACTHS